MSPSGWDALLQQQQFHSGHKGTPRAYTRNAFEADADARDSRRGSWIILTQRFRTGLAARRMHLLWPLTTVQGRSI
jgi:hypothetical protein